MSDSELVQRWKITKGIAAGLTLGAYGSSYIFFGWKGLIVTVFILYSTAAEQLKAEAANRIRNIKI